MLLYVLLFVTKDSFLDYRFEYIHVSIYCYTIFFKTIAMDLKNWNYENSQVKFKVLNFN